MSDLIVVGFKNNRFKASEVLNRLRQMDEDWTVNLAGYGGKVLNTTLSDEQAAKIEKILNQGRTQKPKAA